MKTLRYSLILSLVLSLGFFSLQAQTVSATSEKIYVDYVVATESTLEIIAPEFMAGGTRGFKEVPFETIEIKGVVGNESGVKSLLLNGTRIDFSTVGVFDTKVDLYVGENVLTFDIIDNNNNTTTKEFIVNRFKEVEEADFNLEAKYYALIIGVQDYEDPGILDLDNPIKDATALYDVLTQKYTFEPENTFLMQNPKRDEIFDKLDELSAKVTTNDNLLIFYAGHGYWDDEAEIGYWLPSDAEEGKKRDWMRNSTVTEYVREIQSHHTLLITDACFGGSIFKTRKAFKDASMAINKVYEIPSRKAMTSGTLTEVPDKSVFMKYLLKQLETNDIKHVASEQVFYNIKPAVLNNSPNTPQFGVMQNTGDEGGDFVFIMR